jgi:hypothetical protein
MSISVVNPKLFVLDPDPEPRVLHPDLEKKVRILADPDPQH